MAGVATTEVDVMARRARSVGFHNLLVATDLSEASDWAIRRVARLPLVEEAEVGLLHVLPEGMPTALRKEAEVEAWAGLERAALALRANAPALQVEPLLCSGKAFIEIIRRARNRDAELIVVGRHGRRQLRDLMLGTTAQNVVRKADLPVLIVSRPADDAYRRPVIATDLQDTSRRLLTLGLRVLGSERPRIAVVHAYKVPFEGLVASSWSAREQRAWRKERESEASETMGRLLEHWPDREFVTVVKPGDPRQVIHDELVRRRADLVVLGTHARAGLAHVLLGSVAEWVLNVAPCDVLMGRPARFSFQLP